MKTAATCEHPRAGSDRRAACILSSSPASRPRNRQAAPTSARRPTETINQRADRSLDSLHRRGARDTRNGTGPVLRPVKSPQRLSSPLSLSPFLSQPIFFVSFGQSFFSATCSSCPARFQKTRNARAFLPSVKKPRLSISSRLSLSRSSSFSCLFLNRFSGRTRRKKLRLQHRNLAGYAAPLNAT